TCSLKLIVMTKFLVIDNDEKTSNLIQDVFTDMGYHKATTSCKSVAQGIDVMANNKINIVFINLQMPGMEKMKLMDELEYEKPLIIATSADEDAFPKAFEMGARDLILKPATYERIAKSI